MRKAIFVVICGALILTGFNEIWQSLGANAASVETVHMLSQQDQDALLQLYWDYDLDQAIASDSIDVNPTRSLPDDAITTRAILATLSGNYQEVLKIAASDPEHCLERSACRLLAGKASYILGQNDAAVLFWSEPNLWRKLVGTVAKTPRNQADLDRLDRYYTILRDVYPDEPDAYFMLGSIRRSLGKWEEALPYFEQAAMLGSGRPRFLCSWGAALIITATDSRKGSALCEEAIALNPEDMWLYFSFGRALSMSGACDEALRMFQYVAEKFPNSSEPQDWLENHQTGRFGSCNSKNTLQSKHKM